MFVDIVFCVDVSGSMAEHLEHVKKKILQMPKDLIAFFAGKDDIVQTLRVRLVQFANLVGTPDSLEATEFFVVHQHLESHVSAPITQLAEFESVVKDLSVLGDGNEHESALEALDLAVGSEWIYEEGYGFNRRRHIVVMFTDTGAHPLESQAGEASAAFRKHRSASLDELTDRWWSNGTPFGWSWSRRLLIFAPDTYPWNVIGDSWVDTIWFPSQAGKTLEDVENEMIMNALWARAFM